MGLENEDMTSHRVLLRVFFSISFSAVYLGSACGADFFDFLKSRQTTIPGASAVAALSNDQVVSGLKEALSKGVQFAVTNLGRADGFLKDAKVKIPLPPSLQKVEQALRLVRQDQLADDFITTMNRGAEAAVPEAAAVLGESVKQMSLADAKAILTSTNTAATDYFRRTSWTNLHARFLPIVQQATAKAGVTASYKRMTERAGLSSFGGFGSSLLGKDTLDIDDYVTRRSLEGLFLKIADQEKQIRENPVARTTDLLQKVFSATKSSTAP